MKVKINISSLLSLLLFFSLFKKLFSSYIYFTCNISCGNDYPEYITSSEGNFPPTNPNNIGNWPSDYYYIFTFDPIKHNLENQLCMKWVNLEAYGGFSFEYIAINEYIITFIDYEKHFICDDCNINVPKKFSITNEICKNTPVIKTINNPGAMTFCLAPHNITDFYINENYINKKYYIGRTLDFIMNNEIDIINIIINELFFINGYESLIFYPDTVSFKVIKIINYKGKILNENEELFEGSFFNMKNNSLNYKKNNSDEGYSMTVHIATKPLNRDISLITCEEVAKIYLYVSQKNCTMNESSNNFCQKCIKNYGKNINENKCYHKLEKFTNLYYDDSNQIWNDCNLDNNQFTCSICPSGTYIKDSSSNLCEKCPKGEYNSFEDKNECKKCLSGYYSDIIGSTLCKKCPKEKYSLIGFEECLPCNQIISHCDSCSEDLICQKCNNNALSGFSNCSICENEYDWEFTGEYCNLITICQNYFYKDKNNNSKIHCIESIKECPKGMDYLNLDTHECEENVTAQKFLNFSYQVKGGFELLNKVSDDIIFELKNFSDFIEEFKKKNKLIIKGIDSKMEIGNQ